MVHLQWWIAGCHQKLGERHGMDALRAFRRNQPCQHLDFSLLNCKRINFSFKPPSLWLICYGSPGKLTYYPQKIQFGVWESISPNFPSRILLPISTEEPLPYPTPLVSGGYNCLLPPHPTPCFMSVILRIGPRDIWSQGYGEGQGFFFPSLNMRSAWGQASEFAAPQAIHIPQLNLQNKSKVGSRN